MDPPRARVVQAASSDSGEHDPVMQSGAPPAPELDLVRDDPITTPKWRHRHLASGRSLGELGEPTLVLGL